MSAEIQWAPNTGVTSEVGRLRTVLLHRPGRELRRITPRNHAELLFDGMPWVDRAQEEHDAFAELLRSRGITVLLLHELLAETLAIPDARQRITEATVTLAPAGSLALERYLTQMLDDLTPESLADVLMAGLRNDEVSPAAPRTIVTSLLADDAYLFSPLPNLFFTRDSSVWINENPLVTELFYPARVRESMLLRLIYDFHPSFIGHSPIEGQPGEFIEGGDILVLAEGVLAVGVSERTSAAGCERLARHLFTHGQAHAIVAVPMQRERAMMHLDTICTMVDIDAAVMYPNVAQHLEGVVIRPGESDSDELRIGRVGPFLEAAAEAMGIDRLRQIDTGLDPHEAEREQWDDGNNTLAIAPKVCVAYERNKGTNARLEAEGIEVLAITGSELGSGRGGPRCMSCPISREPVTLSA